MPVLKLPLFAVAVCGCCPVFVHVTVSPTWMVIVAGEKLKSTIEPGMSAAACASPATSLPSWVMDSATIPPLERAWRRWKAAAPLPEVVAAGGLEVVVGREGFRGFLGEALACRRGVTC